MFGMISFRAKVMAVLQQEFGYKPAVPGWQGQLFNTLTQTVKKGGGNEYDGAVAFMLALSKSLPEEDEEVRRFKEKTFTTATALVPSCKLGNWVEQAQRMDP